MLNCLLVDDEVPALRLLTDYVNKIPDLHLAGTAEDAFQALELLHTNRIDLLFLDIEMPELTGIEMLKSLVQKPYVVLITAYKEYALESYDLNVVDYLLKPVTFDRFLKATNKVIERNRLKNNSAFSPTINESKDHFFVKADYKLVKIYFNEILYIEGLSEYVRIHTEKEKIITLQSLKNLESILPESMFLRIHKSFIVSIPKIKAIVGNAVEIAGSKLTIGKSYRDKALKILKE